MPVIAKLEIVINVRYGGYGISRKAAAELIRRGQPQAVAVATEQGITADQLDCEKPRLHSRAGEPLIMAIYDMQDQIPRHDPVLVAVVRELGKAANRDGSKLAIKEFYVGYEVTDEDDGIETLGSYSL